MKALEIAVQYYGIFIIYLLLIFSLGRALRIAFRHFFHPQSFFTEVFFSLMVGQVIISTFTAIFYTKGQTSHWLFLVLAISLLFFATKKTVSPLRLELPSLKNILLLLGGSVLLFSWEAYFLLKSGDFSYVIPFKDMFAYSNISYYLPITGEENNYHYLNQLNPDYNGIRRYHYLTLWNNAFVNQLFGGLSILNYILITIGSFNFCVWLGFIALWETVHKKTPTKAVLFCTLFLFLGAFIFSFYKEIYLLRHAHNLYLTLFDFVGKKSSYYYCFWLVCFLLFHQNQTLQGLIIVLMLAVVTFVSVPAVLGGLGCFILFLIFTASVLRRKIYLVIVAILLYLTGIFLFDTVWGLAQDGQYGFLTLDSYIAFTDINYWKTTFKFFVGTGGQLVVLYLPYIVFILLSIKEDLSLIKTPHRNTIILCFSVTFSALLAWSLLRNMHDTWQLFMYPALSILHVTIIYYIIASKTTQRKFVTFIVLALMLFNTYTIIDKHARKSKNLQTDTYLKQVILLHKNKQLNKYGAVLRSPNSYKNVYDKGTFLIKIGRFVRFLDNELHPISISDFEIPEAQKLLEGSKATTQTDRIISQSLFFKFVMEQKRKNTFVSVTQSQLDFIKKYQLNYLVLEKGGRLSPELERLIKKRIMDSNTGEQFLLLEIDNL